MQERSIALPPTPLSNGLPRLQASAAQWRPYHRDTRDRTGGRPWEYFVSCSMTRTRVPSDRQWSLIKNWCLDNPTERLLLCNLGRAEGIMRRRLRKSKPSNLTVNEAVRQTQLTPTERDALHLAYHPGEVCHTMTSSNANLYWVCGSGCKQGFLLRQELSSFMGMDCFANLSALHLHKIPDSIASSWIAESVHRRMATHCAEVSLSMIPQKSRYDIGSLYSGGFDALAHGILRSRGKCAQNLRGRAKQTQSCRSQNQLRVLAHFQDGRQRSHAMPKGRYTRGVALLSRGLQSKRHLGPTNSTSLCGGHSRTCDNSSNPEGVPHGSGDRAVRWAAHTPSADISRIPRRARHPPLRMDAPKRGRAPRIWRHALSRAAAMDRSKERPGIEAA